MRFSVLLPTRDRIDLLRYAVESVRRQDYEDWELIVSDNQSGDDVRQYLDALNDPRVRWSRTERLLPVTDNWNLALGQSQGDYVVMLGDDDGLLPGYFRALSDLIDRYGGPDAIYCEALQFVYPGVLPGHDSPFVQRAYSELFAGQLSPFLADPRLRLDAVRRSMRLRLSFSYNMQHLLLNRKLLDRLKPHGPLFQSPYPDYFASNLVMLEAEQVVMVPQPMVAIGVSPKSFGFYYFNERAEEGTAMLASFSSRFEATSARGRLLDGNPLLTGWYLAMASLEDRVGARHRLRADTDRYRYLQVSHAVQRDGLRAISGFWPLLSISERVRFTVRLAVFQVLRRLLPARLGGDFAAAWLRRESPWPPFHPDILIVDSRTILELFEHTVPVALSGAHTEAISPR